MSTVRQGLERLRAAGVRGAERGIVLGTEHVLGVSREHVPHEEATLERSGKASQEGLRGAVSYDTPYAVVQHEDLTLAHDPGRTAKYLENAFNSERTTVAKIVATAVRREIGT